MISLVMAALGASLAAAAPLDEGFRGRTWGSAPSEADKACKSVPDPITEGVRSIFCDEPLIKDHPLQVMAMFLPAYSTCRTRNPCRGSESLLCPGNSAAASASTPVMIPIC